MLEMSALKKLACSLLKRGIGQTSRHPAPTPVVLWETFGAPTKPDQPNQEHNNE